MHTGNIVAAWVTAAADRFHAVARSTGLEQRELSALTLIATHEGCSVEWLRGRIELSQSGTVRLIDRLAGRGMVRRGPSIGRGVPLYATDDGRAALRRWHEARDEAVAELLNGLPASRRELVVQSLAAALLASTRRRSEADATCRTCSWAACGNDCPVDGSVEAYAP
ncbi:MarR family winged helix-turn-helix transcriptional regulator [Micromonospora sp. CPCC 206061]|uniref:MarR family winged helix-turn-helix transcriptional regulator n=1 Tax=Micromonospora sp. CPCC 206061 TaxID=3122410 RepID=UPI002FF17E94